MKKRILALTGAVLLLAMYASTMVFALIDSPRAAEMFQISLYCTIVIPVIIYAGMLIYKNAHNRKELPFTEDETEQAEEPDREKGKIQKTDPPFADK